MDIKDITALKEQLRERADLSPDQADRAARVALEFFADRAPQVREMVDKAGGVDKLAHRIGGLFGG